MAEKEEISRKRRELQKELDFLTTEQNQKELEISELRDRLRKREDELRDLKLSLNTQIEGVYDQYKGQVDSLTRENKEMKDE